jgi:hypothetical protein
MRLETMSLIARRTTPSGSKEVDGGRNADEQEERAKPGRRPIRWQDYHLERRALLIPHAVVVRALDMKAVGARVEVGV